MNRGKLLLRIDDIDSLRIKREYLDDIFFTLEWLGIDWDEGPFSVSEHEKYFSQKNKTALYESYIALLQYKQLTFACRCSRKKMESESENAQYAGTCRDRQLPYSPHQTALRIITPENSACVRFKEYGYEMATINLYHHMRDFIIKRKDGLPAYQIVSVADDILHDINFIVRGEDLLYSTAAQVFLSQHFEKNRFADTVFFHHRLIRDAQGVKLSKSAGSDSVKAIREQNRDASGVFQLVGSLLQLSSPVSSARDLLQYAIENTATFQQHMVRYARMQESFIQPN
jgi:glutamyl-tRNA synthetase